MVPYLQCVVDTVKFDALPTRLTDVECCEYVCSPLGMKEFGTTGRDLAANWLWAQHYCKLIK
jgi:hypothetical protein